MIKKFTILIFCLIVNTCVFAQNEPIIIQAESGTLGSEFSTVTEGNVTFIRWTNLAAGSPGTANRVATYNVEFQHAGTYALYARLRVGPNNFDDDSFLYGNGFGTKDVTDDNAWILANGLAGVGFSVSTDVVTGGGSQGSGMWKWLKISEFNGGEAPITFTVEEGNLSQTFQIGTREDGLDIDKFVFALNNLYFTVANLDNGEAGSTELPEDPVVDPDLYNPIAKGKDKFLGNIYSTSQLPDWLDYWNQVTPENAGKWISVERSRDVMTWGQLDNAYKLAKDNGLPFRMHVLVWGNQQPTWLKNLTSEEQLDEIKEWFQAVAQRYPHIDYLEVVNEPLHDPPINDPNDDESGGYINALGGWGVSGHDWIINAFKLAREYFPATTKLMINEYNILSSSSNTQSYLNIINKLKAENLIDVVGVQGHAFSTLGTAASIKANLDKLAEAQLPIQVTELDIDGPTDQVQLDDYKKIIPVLWEHPAVTGITLWGWRTGMWRTDQKAYLINPTTGAERPALVWLRNYINPPPVTNAGRDLEQHVNIYPNPSYNGNVTISGVGAINKIRVMDISGTKIKEVDLNNVSLVELELNVTPGLYIIQMIDGNKSSYKKLMVQ